MRIYLKIAICLSSLIILNSSCKKETPASGGSSPATPLTPYNNVYGVLISSKSVYYYAPSFFDTSYNAVAIFYNTPQPSTGTSTTATVTSVSINNKPLFPYSAGPGEIVYEDTATNPNLSSVNWQVQGAGVIPSFVNTPTTLYPSYTGYNLLPDTINIGQSSGIVIHMAGITSADSLYIDISSGSSEYQSPHTIASPASYTIPQSKLTGLTVSNSGLLSVSFEKILIQNINGKNFVFTKEYQFNKAVVIINQ